MDKIFCRCLHDAQREAAISGHSLAIVKHLRNDEWEIMQGQTVLIPDVIVRKDGRALAYTVAGRRALAQAT